MSMVSTKTTEKKLFDVPCCNQSASCQNQLLDFQETQWYCHGAKDTDIYGVTLMENKAKVSKKW